MTNEPDVTSKIVEEVLSATLTLPWAKNGELDSEARAIARQLSRIRSHRDAAAAIQRVVSSSFGDSVWLNERELEWAGRLLVLRLREAGLVAAPITLEGFTSEELLSFVSRDLRETVFSGKPLVFSVASAQVLASFRIEPDRLVAELAHIDGGGEGVLAFLSALLHEFASANGVDTIEWLVHALTCAAPNTRLRALLERRGFTPFEYQGRPVLRRVSASGQS
ncbi:MAG TPA: hypothetical protein VHM25_10480 [Polyangiaceae bacterium]|jgi:hypothetical protein|nr:hypothetical protein [Polyangiaceae bacterium]